PVRQGDCRRARLRERVPLLQKVQVNYRNDAHRVSTTSRAPNGRMSDGVGKGDADRLRPCIQSPKQMMRTEHSQRPAKQKRRGWRWLAISAAEVVLVLLAALGIVIARASAIATYVTERTLPGVQARIGR